VFVTSTSPAQENAGLVFFCAGVEERGTEKKHLCIQPLNRGWDPTTISLRQQLIDFLGAGVGDSGAIPVRWRARS
jgi:hypothetical protein